MNYSENQFGWIAIIGIGGIIIYISLIYFYQWGSDPIPPVVFLPVLFLFIIMLLLFFRMKTEADRKRITISYGIGLIKKRIPIIDIEEVSVVRNKWYYGLGIRVLRGGVLYNIHSLKGIELTIKDKKKYIRIGSRYPEKLKSEILKRIKFAGR